ncbi:MAG: type 4a pilus biogenesis protein PilO [Candidatus Omnitrophota bacterium]|jgi:Tfp pilus assembly protein PilO
MIKFLEEIKKINLIEKFALDNKKIALIVIIAAMFLYLDFNYLLKAQMSGVKKPADEIVKLKNDFKALDLGLKNMQNIRSQQKNLPQQKAKKIIADYQIASLLQDISKIGNTNNVKILQIKPFREAQKAAATSKFSPVIINLDLICGYHDLGKFINGLENNQAFISIESFKIEARPEEALNQRVSLTVKTYVKI